MTIRKFKDKVPPVYRAVQIPETTEGLPDLLQQFMGEMPYGVEEYPIVDGSGGIGLQVYNKNTNVVLNVVTGDYLVINENNDTVEAYDSSFPEQFDEVQ